MANINSSNAPNPSNLQYILEHVFLPPKIPSAEEENIFSKDSTLLAEVSKAAIMFKAALSRRQGVSEETTRAWDTMNRMLKAMKAVRPGDILTKSNIEAELRRMDVGDVLPIYVSQQNAGIIFRKCSAKELTFESFEISLPNEVITGTVGKVVVQYPANPRLPVPVHNELLSALANAISFLDSQYIGDVYPVSKKAGVGHENVRDTPSPRYITEALAGFLRGVGPIDSTKDRHGTVFIQKRIDDCILFGGGKAGPWRRSAIWLLIRVSMQTTLEQLDITGSEGYKAFQAYFMAHLLQQCIKVQPNLLPDDIIDTMNRKLARRMWKLKEFVDVGTFPVLSFAADVITEVATVLKQRWDESRKDCSKPIEWNAPSDHSIEESLNLTLRFSQSYLLTVVGRTQELAGTCNPYNDVAQTNALVSACSKRLYTHNSELPGSINNAESEISLMDFECWVETQLPSWSNSPRRSASTDCSALSSILSTYIQRGRNQYSASPERMSIYWLTVLELWIALDKLVVNWDPLMKMFSPSIPENLLDPLLLPSVLHLKRLDVVQSYLRGRYSASSKGSLFGNINSAQSFQNLYFVQSPKLQQEKARIEKWGREEKERTLQAMRDANGEHVRLTAEALGLSCEEIRRLTSYGDYVMVHYRWCRKCGLNTQADGLRTGKFEDPLPTNPQEANTLVFELNCPEPFGIWREATYSLLLQSCSHSGTGGSNVYTLQAYSPTNRFHSSHARTLSVASSAAAIANTYLGKSRPLPATPDDVIFPHAGHYLLCYQGSWLETIGGSILRPMCTFKLDKPYQSLTLFLEDTNHTPNAVIASQAKCPITINPGEYLTFGQLRSGNGIQLRNIMRALNSDSLSFNEAGIHSLIMQTIWQAGPRAESWYRDAHQDISDKKFANDMLVILKESLEKVGDSGREVLHLATLTALATRLLSLSQDSEIKESCLSFLEATRGKASAWLEAARAQEASSTEDNSSRLQHKMAMIAVVCRLTFDVDADAMRILCDSPANITTLLFARMTTAADSTQHASLPNATQLLLRRDRYLAYRLESYIASILRSNDEPLHEATFKAWNGYQRGQRWNPLYSHGSRWWKCMTSSTGNFTARTVHVNILTGEMLVDGKTIARLPSSYVDNDTFRCLFEKDKSVSLRTRPSTMQGMEYEATYSGMQLHFSMIDNSLVVRVHREGAVEEYIPQNRIQGDVSTSFVRGQQHWYIERPEGKVIEFRPSDSRWRSDTHVDWAMRISVASSGLRGTLQKSFSDGFQTAMDPHSRAFKILHDAVKGLEPVALNMTAVAKARSPQPPLLGISLPNHSLDFFVNPSNCLESRSFPDYILDTSQDIGCLYGLVDRVILRDNSPSRRMRKILVPRGSITAVASSQRYPTIRVRVEERAGFHAYEVDTLVGRLLGNGTMESDLFLIQLHAFTSSHLPDPLTSRTGTEEALESLRSASLLSDHDFRPNWRRQMEDIAAISPRRQYYPQWSTAMEQVTWNPNLPISSQHSAFQEHISVIFEYWADVDISKTRVAETKGLKVAPGMISLSRRAALRDLRTTVSHSALQKHEGDDRQHTYRDVMQCSESRKREVLAYQTAFSAQHLATGLPVCSTLEQTAMAWAHVKYRGTWDCTNFSEWFVETTPLPPHIWSTLYNLCRIAPREQASPRYNIAMMLSMLAYRDSIPLSLLGTLLLIIRDEAFLRPEFDYPLPRTLEMNLGYQFDESKIRALVNAKEIGFSASEEANLANAPGSSHEERLRRRRAVYDLTLKGEVNKVIDELKRWWLDIRNQHSAIAVTRTPRLQDLTAYIRSTIQPLIERWDQNKLFLEHLAGVDRQILRTPNRVAIPLKYHPPPTVFMRSHDDICDVGIEDLMNRREPIHKDICVPISKMPTFARQQSTEIHVRRVQEIGSLVHRLALVLRGQMEERYRDDLICSVEAFSESPTLSEAQIPTAQILDAFCHAQELYHDIMRTQLTGSLSPSSPAENLLSQVGLWPRITALVLLSRLSSPQRNDTVPKWRAVISIYANQIITVQRGRRLLHYGTRSMEAEYNREIMHGRQRKPVGELDWLLVEIDADVCIRSDQMDVANAMIAPNGDQNTVMQLNMGEGKSSVIVPIAATTLANTRQLARVVVLKPQSRLQLNLLRRRVSKLANRRILSLPFSRDLKVDLTTARNISRILEECRTSGGIWLCQPEHLLSFKLLGLDLSMRASENPGVGAELIRCQLWMQEHTRDILDESDEILHTRHQLVYTVGDQSSFDGAPMRWIVVQELLSLLQSRLSSTNSPHFVAGPSPSPGQFPWIRVMSEEGLDLFHQLAREVVFGSALPSIRIANLSTRLKNAALRLLTERHLPADDPELTELSLYFEENSEALMWQSLLLVRGLIAFNILPLALRNKRWRVDYGHDLRRSQLAVPYRAKDSPSLRSDFAHPDVLVLLTCLAYYYRGLDDSMIVKTVKALLKLDNPELIYEEWISPYRNQISTDLHRLAGVNVDDDKMIVSSLRPFVQRNKRVIDFFLNQCIFPREAKEFPFKMSTSGWDLAMKKPNPTTGFSGTNDSRFLLPTSIVQQDSLAQRHTNAKVLAQILQEENTTVICHANNLKSEQILNIIWALEEQPTVLLDVGAQVLDCSNAELVTLWLLKYGDDSKIKAAVFFDDKDNMCIMERDGFVQSFADSPYSSRLDECLVYLDDAHTRGTDLKLPACRAAVTLGPRLTKDKLVQGCMRMRKLGSQQSLVFLAPDEVIREVGKVTRDEEGPVTIQSSHVLLWAMKETCRQLQVNVPNWAMQGYEFAARQVGWSQMAAEGTRSAQEIKDLFCQEEGRSLDQLYGVGEREVLRGRPGQPPSTLAEQETREAIDRHCMLFESFSLDEARVQEEQEVELVHEQEVEREVERPPAATPAPHSIHPDVRQFALTGILNRTSPGFHTVQQSLKHTSLALPTGGVDAFGGLIVTNDFYRTIQLSGVLSASRMDDFLRPVEWLVGSRIQPSPSLVAFSPFEVNELLPIFRTSSKVKLHLFAPCTSVSMRSLDDLQLFTLPTNIARNSLLPGIAQQLNLYSGTLYLRNFETYEGVCAALRLHFGEIEDPEIADMGVINSNGFVKDAGVRSTMGLVGKGFDEDPVQFFRKLFYLRRNGRSFLPSHMGQILFGVGLTEASFVVEAAL